MNTQLPKLALYQAELRPDEVASTPDAGRTATAGSVAS
jgi:hypothetical protein